MGGPITPDSGGSPNAEDIDTLYRLALYIGLVVFLIVEGTLFWSIWRYRRRRGGRPAAQIRGNAPLEIGWTVAAVLILIVLTTVTFLYLDDIKDPPGTQRGFADGTQLAAVDQEPPPRGENSLEITVNGQQFVWRYDYPGTAPLYSYYAMVVPVRTTVTLKISSSDVIHSWWIPTLGGKADAVPGQINRTWFRAPETGVYRGTCAELCGYNHAEMRAAVRVVGQAEFRDWARRKRAQIAAAGMALARQRRAAETRAGG
jgi:cytochrome c oxidase subunit 2